MILSPSIPRVALCLLAFACAWAQAPSDAYLLGPNDQVSVHVRDVKEVEFRPARIDVQGNLELHYAGKLRAAGLSTSDLADRIAERLRTIINEPHVTVEVTDYGSQPVSVMGAVNKPGTYQLRGRKSLVEVLSLAEGLRTEAGHGITIIRQREWGAIPVAGATGAAAGPYSARVQVAAVMEGRDPAANILVRPHDVITVARAEMVYVVGSVRRSGGFVLGEKESMTVLQAVALAEGLDHTAAAKGARIIRSAAPGDKPSEIPVDLRKILSNKSPDHALRPNDILFVPNSAAKRAALRSVEVAIQMATGVVIWRR